MARIYPTGALAEAVEDALNLPPETRIAELRAVRERLSSLLGRIDTYISSAELERENTDESDPSYGR
jgi:hypothetical protein